MTTAKLWAGLAAAALATLSACSDVESCKRGIDPGCVGSAPDDSGNCLYNFVLSSDGRTCLEPGSERDGGGGGGDTCSCASGKLCRDDGKCVDLCEPVRNPPVPRPVLMPCRATEGETDSFARSALALCYQNCMHRAVYCGTACNPDTECTQFLASAAARLQCQGSEDQACAIRLCEAARDLPCAQQQCPPGSSPSCSGTLCSNNCDTPEFNNDGICDDGDPSNAISYACDYGTDCGDCGPRKGGASSAPPATLDIGDVCADSAQCGGDLGHVKTSTGWCVPATEDQSYSRCVPDCSNGKACHAGYDCFGIVSDPDGPNGPMPQEQYEDVNDHTLVFGCFPAQCGG
jgi:hypothetical protein